MRSISACCSSSGSLTTDDHRGMTDTTLVLPAPAKLNLMLHITGRRPDGYHELQTVFQFIDYADELRFDLRHDDRIVRHARGFDIDESDDITMRAANALRDAYRASGVDTPGVDITLDKRLPMGAGLGGGSSDAATTLLALNHLWGGCLDIEQLADIGLKLGADVPVFVRGSAAFGEGVGEILTPVELPEAWYVVVVPPVHVSTRKVFEHPDLTRDCSAIKICDLLQTEWRNVCTEVVAADYRPVSQAIEIIGDLSADSAGARMSGSGASVFTACADKRQAEQILKKVQANPVTADWICFIARGLNRSPVHQRLGIEP